MAGTETHGALWLIVVRDGNLLSMSKRSTAQCVQGGALRCAAPTTRRSGLRIKDGDVVLDAEGVRIKYRFDLYHRIDDYFRVVLDVEMFD